MFKLGVLNRWDFNFCIHSSPQGRSTQYNGVARSLCNPPVNAGPQGCQIIMHSTSQHRPTRWSDHRAFHQSTHDHMAVRSSCIPPANTIPHGGQNIVHSTSQHSTTWWSDHRAFHRSAQDHMVVRSKACEERGKDESSAWKPLLFLVRTGL